MWCYKTHWVPGTLGETSKMNLELSQKRRFFLKKKLGHVQTVVWVTVYICFNFWQHLFHFFLLSKFTALHTKKYQTNHHLDDQNKLQLLCNVSVCLSIANDEIYLILCVFIQIRLNDDISIYSSWISGYLYIQITYLYRTRLPINVTNKRTHEAHTSLITITTIIIKCNVSIRSSQQLSRVKAIIICI